MTEKRYNVWDIDGTIFLEDHKEGSYHIGQVGNVDINCLNDIAKLLNELNDENEQLKQINRNLQDFRNFITEQNVLNEKQRKELQLQMLRLYNYFENWFEDTMSPTAFSEMWDSVKEDKKWEKRWWND